MLRASAVIGLALVAQVSFGQSSSPQAMFEAADVHSGPRSTSLAMRTVVRGGRYELQNATMVDLVRTAYGIDAENVIGGPNWVDFDRFEVIAKAAADTPSETLKSNLQALLADRFKLTVHNDAKPMTTFVLAQGKGKHKLKEADSSGKTGCDIQPMTVRMVEGGRVIGQTSVSCHNMTMTAFAADLRRLASGYFTTAVMDSTELKGAWDFDLKFTPKSLGPLATDVVTIFEAVDKQLGLTLEEKSLPRPVVVIDQVNRKPTDNPPGLEKKLPALPPAEFEAATLKPVDPNFRQTAPGFIGVQAGGRVNLPPLSLKLLMSLAWGNSVNTDEMVGAPKWIDSARFTLVAKLPAEYVATNGSTGLVDIGPMLQALITEQFKMKAHFEDRPVTAYTLVGAKPKLKKADPSTRTGCKSANSGGIVSLDGSAPLPSTQVTCQNITMAQFVNQLQIFASSYLRHPLVDATGLEGTWDFAFSFSAVNPAQIANLRASLPVGNPNQAASASDPISGTTVFEALEKQLGLKLEQQKRPYPIFIIDHIEPLEGQSNGPDLPVLR
jgi:uncharacterized protein (TIGR03435 family)